ncbi:serine/threonine protein kinase [Chloroflexi bacterium CFX3]|nr:serine/threonine protein kinase [Chloroflexi bacterium CFX3]
MDESRPKQLGAYRVLSLIGKGGMARVYRCQHVETGEIAAVKVLYLAEQADPNTLTLFEREIRAMQQLRHPYIVSLRDYHLSAQLAYIVMPFFESSVADRLMVRLYSPREAAQTLTHLAHALDYAHSLGYIHCDLKPSNLMLDAKEQLYLADFGLAKSIGRRNPEQFAFGTPPYMAPELADGAAADIRTDVYALGVLLCELLSGHRPFEAERTTDYFYLHRRALPPAPSQLNAVPAVLDKAILSALSKAPAERPQSAGELAQHFRNAVATLPDKDQRWNAPHIERPHIVLKPVKGGSGILRELNEQPTLMRRPDQLSLSTTEHRAAPPSPARRTRRTQNAVIAVLLTGLAAILLLITFLITR